MLATKCCNDQELDWPSFISFATRQARSGQVRLIFKEANLSSIRVYMLLYIGGGSETNQVLVPWRVVAKWERLARRPERERVWLPTEATNRLIATHIPLQPQPSPCRDGTVEFSCSYIREAVKYYFADFVRKGGGGDPPNP